MANEKTSPTVNPLARYMARKGLEGLDIERLTKEKAAEMGIPKRGMMPRHSVYRVLNGNRAGHSPTHAQGLVLGAIHRDMAPGRWLDWHREREQDAYRERVRGAVAESWGVDVAELDQDTRAMQAVDAILTDVPLAKIRDGAVRRTVKEVRARLDG